MMRRLWAFVPIFLFALLALMLWKGMEPEAPSQNLVPLDRAVPVFALASIDEEGGHFTQRDIVGRVALINVFGSWCPPCRREHAVLLDIASSEGTPIFGVNWSESRDQGRRFLEDFGNPFERAGNDEGGRLAIELGVSGAPETYIVDRRGRIRYKYVGAITSDIWRDVLNPIVAGLEAER